MDDDFEREAHARVGGTLGKYRLDAVLGVGGTASVYAGTHRNGSRAAIKVLHTHFSANESMRSRFLREGYVANKVDHPGAVRVIDDETTNDVSYLVMELLEGETLDARASRIGGVLPIPDAVHHGIALLDILERAHAAGIVHRDLKPENLFLTTRQELKVLDFGIARLRDTTVSATKTQTGTMLGTPAYLAPEQALGHVDEIDARSDLWATGATLFTLLTGRHVHQGRSAQEILVLAATRHAPPIKQLAPHLPDALAHVVDRALRFRREERWASAHEMKNALAATGLARLTVPIGHSEPLTAPADGSRHALTIMTSASAPRSTTSRSLALAGVLFALVSLGGIAGGLFVLKRRAATEPTPPPAPAAASAEPEIEALPLPSASASIEPAMPSSTPEPAAVAEESDAGAIARPKPAALPKPVPKPVKSGTAKDLWDPRNE